MKSILFPSPAQYLRKHPSAPVSFVMSQIQPPNTTPPPSPASLSATLLPSPNQKCNPSTIFRPQTQRSLIHSLADWHPLNVPKSELSLPLTLPTGQTFGWRLTGPSQFTGVIGPHLISLKNSDQDRFNGVHFFLHDSTEVSSARAALIDYLNLDISLAELWRGFAAADPRFEAISRRFDGGARVLRQDPVECVLQFICSSNNNIARIEKMVGVLSSYGEYLGTVGGFRFYEFPTLERLSVVSEQRLREAGFGYRYAR